MDPDDVDDSEMFHLFRGPTAGAPRLDDAAVDYLLSGDIDPDDAPAGYSVVAELLAIVSGPPTMAELAGEERAVLAFLEALHEPGSAAKTRARNGIRTRRLAVGVAAGGLLLTSSGLAAATGHLPEPLQRVAHDSLDQVGIAVPDPDDPSGDKPSPGPQTTSVGPTSTGSEPTTPESRSGGKSTTVPGQSPASSDSATTEPTTSSSTTEPTTTSTTEPTTTTSTTSTTSTTEPTTTTSTTEPTTTSTEPTTTSTEPTTTSSTTPPDSVPDSTVPEQEPDPPPTTLPPAPPAPVT